MNKKVLWISVASVATLGIGGFFAWRYFKKKKDEKSAPAEETKQVAGQAAQATPPPHIDIDENVVYISAKWCPACKKNEPTAVKIFDKYKEKVDFIRLDADEEKAKSYGFQLKQSQIPTLVFVNEGEVLEALVGVKGEEEYDAAFQKYFPSLFEEAKKQAEVQPEPEVQESAPATTSEEEQVEEPENTSEDA